jgi:hypothetical protein
MNSLFLFNINNILSIKQLYMGVLMSKRLSIGKKVFDFPTSSTEPNWGPVVTNFAEEVSNNINNLNENVYVQNGVMRIDGAAFNQDTSPSFPLTNGKDVVTMSPIFDPVTQTGKVALHLELYGQRDCDTNVGTPLSQLSTIDFYYDLDSQSFFYGSVSIVSYTITVDDVTGVVSINLRPPDVIGDAGDPTHTGFIAFRATYTII